MGAPSYSPPPPDPLVTQAEQTAQNQLITGLQTTTRSDTASLMAQYGALASALGAASPTPSAAATGPAAFGKVA